MPASESVNASIDGRSVSDRVLTHSYSSTHTVLESWPLTVENQVVHWVSARASRGSLAIIIPAAGLEPEMSGRARENVES